VGTAAVVVVMAGRGSPILRRAAQTGISLRDISSELAQRGIMNERGKPFSAASINSMLVRECARGRSFLR
jgi:hypothetical protein